MGAYLSAPITDKESDEGTNSLYHYGVCAMQGWRTDMEDAHMVQLNIDNVESENQQSTAMFGVFDGHGGKEVARFAAAHLPAVVRSLDAYQTGDLQSAMAQSFMRLDELLLKQEHQDELKALKGSDSEGGSERGNTEGSAMMINSSQLPEQILEMLGMPGDGGYVFKIVKAPNGQMHIDDFAGEDESASGEEDNNSGSKEVVNRSEDDSPTNASAATAVLEVVNVPGSSGHAVLPADPAAAAGGAGKRKRVDAGPMQIDEDKEEQQQQQPLPGDTEPAGGGPGVSNQEVEIEEIGGAPRAGEWSGPSAGCTAVCAAVRGDMLVVANAGDSRCVLSRGGRAVALTNDHKPTDPEEYARITKAGGFVADGRVNGSLNLSRALGDLEYKQTKELSAEEQMVTAAPEVRQERLQAGEDEFLILACDGIWDVLSNQEAVDFVRARLLAGKTPGRICEEACDHCLAPDTNGCGKGCDNMSIVVVVFRGSNLAKQIGAANAGSQQHQ